MPQPRRPEAVAAVDPVDRVDGVGIGQIGLEVLDPRPFDANRIVGLFVLAPRRRADEALVVEIDHLPPDGDDRVLQPAILQLEPIEFDRLGVADLGKGGLAVEPAIVARVDRQIGFGFGEETEVAELRLEAAAQPERDGIGILGQRCLFDMFVAQLRIDQRGKGEGVCKSWGRHQPSQRKKGYRDRAHQIRAPLAAVHVPRQWVLMARMPTKAGTASAAKIRKPGEARPVHRLEKPRIPPPKPTRPVITPISLRKRCGSSLAIRQCRCGAKLYGFDDRRPAERVALSRNELQRAKRMWRGWHAMWRW